MMIPVKVHMMVRDSDDEVEILHLDIRMSIPPQQGMWLILPGYFDVEIKRVVYSMEDNTVSVTVTDVIEMSKYREIKESMASLQKG